MSKKPTYDELIKKIKSMEESIETYRTLIDNSPDLLYRTDLEGKITYISPSVFRLSGYSVKEAMGMNMAEEVYLYPEERTAFLDKLMKEGQVNNFDARLKRKDGTVWWASTNAHFFRDSNGKILGVEGITRDISDLRNAENSLWALEERFRLAFHTSPDSISITRVSDGMFIDINEGFTEQTGYTREDVAGKSSLDINIWEDPDDRKLLVDGLMKSGHVKNLEARFVRKDGKIIVGLMSARILRISDEDVTLTVTKDITERKLAEEENARLEKQLIQAQKMEAIGRLAGGVAHDLSNMLVPILGYSEILLNEIVEDDPKRKKINQIIKAGSSARDLVRQLLAFGRKQALEYQSLNINETILEYEKLLRRTIREDIDIRITPSPDLKPVLADIGQIEQVIMNLAVNAADSMPDGGTLTIETLPAELDIDFTKVLRGMEPGDYILLAVSDTGYGMNEETRLQIFEPFFSTKGDHGTGLGLATVYGIVRQHRGNLLVHSEPGKGTVFKIYLPVTEKAPLDKTASADHKMNLDGTENILLVEDNDQVLDIVRSILEKHGYRVLAANSGIEAMEIAALPDKQVDLLLTDVVMPDMNGKELFDRLASDNPDLKVIYMSGYTGNAIVHHGVLDDGVSFIQKPFTALSIVSLVRDVLDRKE